MKSIDLVDPDREFAVMTSNYFRDQFEVLNYASVDEWFEKKEGQSNVLLVDVESSEPSFWRKLMQFKQKNLVVPIIGLCSDFNSEQVKTALSAGCSDLYLKDSQNMRDLWVKVQLLHGIN